MISEERLRESARIARDFSAEDFSDGELPFTPSEEFLNKMERLQRQVQRRKAVKRWVQRAACVVAVIGILGSVLLVTDASAREEVKRWIQERTGNLFRYSFSGQPREQTEEYTLGWIPEGYVLVERNGIPGTAVEYYRDEEERYIRFSYMNSGSAGIETREQEKVRTWVHGKPADLFRAEPRENLNELVWEEEDVLFVISAHLEEQELVKMAENVISTKN